MSFNRGQNTVPGTCKVQFKSVTRNRENGRALIIVM